jgi:hypothetical protein
MEMEVVSRAESNRRLESGTKKDAEGTMCPSPHGPPASVEVQTAPRPQQNPLHTRNHHTRHDSAAVRMLNHRRCCIPLRDPLQPRSRRKCHSASAPPRSPPRALGTHPAVPACVLRSVRPTSRRKHIGPCAAAHPQPLRSEPREKSPATAPPSVHVDLTFSAYAKKKRNQSEKMAKDLNSNRNNQHLI